METSDCTPRCRRAVDVLWERVLRIVVLAWAVFCAVATIAGAAETNRQPLDLKPSSSRAAGVEAAQRIRAVSLPAGDAQRVEFLLKSATLFRRLPTKVIECDPRLFTLLMENPLIMVNVWEVLGLSKCRMTQTAPNTYRAHDGNGTHGNIRVLECTCSDRAQNRAIIHTKGVYEGNGLAGAIKAECVILIRSGSVTDRQGKTFVTARVDAFIYLDQPGVNLVARAFQPLILPVADRNFEQTMDFIESFSTAAVKNPRGIERLSRRLTRVHPNVRTKLDTLAEEMARRAESTALKTTAQAARAPAR